MAEVDTSSYPKAQSFNLLGIASEAQSLANAKQQNQLLQTGNAQAKVGLQQSQIDLAHQQYGQLSQFIGSLAQDPRVGTPDGPGLVTAATQQAVHQGWITPAIAQEELANMPKDPAALPQYLQTLNTRVQDAAGQFRQIYGEAGTINNGNQIIPVRTSPIAGVQRIGANIPVQTSPSERNQLVPGVNAQGQQTATPMGQVLQKAGQNPLNGMPMDPGNQLMAPGTAPQNALAQPASAIQPVAGGGVATTPAAGQVDAIATQQRAGSEAYALAQQHEATFQNDVLPLTKSIEQLQALGATGTGPGTDTINQWKSFAQSMGIGPIAGIDPDKITSYDEAKKYLTSYAASIGSTGTNDKLAAAFAGNPSTGISNAAAVNVAKTALAMRRMQNAQVRSFAATGQSPGEYNQYAATFNAKQDPVAYGFDMMDGSQRQKYFKGLSAPEKANFLNSLKTATALGVIAPPSAAAPATTEAPNGG